MSDAPARCEACEAPLLPAAQFCIECGHRQRAGPPPAGVLAPAASAQASQPRPLVLGARTAIVVVVGVAAAVGVWAWTRRPDPRTAAEREGGAASERRAGERSPGADRGAAASLPRGADAEPRPRADPSLAGQGIDLPSEAACPGVFVAVGADGVEGRLARGRQALPAGARLAFRGAPLFDDRHALALADLPDLQGVRLDDPELTDTGIACLAWLPALEALELRSAVRVTGAGFARGGFARLREVAVLDANLGAEGLRGIAALPELRSLRLGYAGEDVAHDPVLDAACRGFAERAFAATARGLGHLARAKRLEALDLAYLPLGDDAVAAIAGLVELRSLRLRHCTQDAGSARILPPLRRLRRLELTRYGPQVIAAAAQLGELEHLVLTWGEVGSDDLAALPPLPKLETLDLSGSVTEATLASLARSPGLRSLALATHSARGHGLLELGGLTRLRSLTWSYGSLEPAAVSWLVRLPAIEEVEGLILDDGALVGLGQLRSLRRLVGWPSGCTALGLGRLARLPELREVRLGYPELPPGAVAALAASPRLERLTAGLALTSTADVSAVGEAKALRELELYLWPGQPAGEGRASLAPLGGLTGLQRLTLDDEGDASVRVDLSFLAALGQLESLTLRLAAATDADLEPLAKLGSLRELRVRCPNAEGAWVRKLGSLRQLHALDATVTGDASLAALAPLAGLRGLRLRGVSDAGLAALDGFADLRSLAIEGSPITAAGLARIVRLRGLLELRLEACPEVTDASLAALADLPLLRFLWVSDTAATGVGLEALAGAALPRLRAVRIWKTQTFEVDDRVVTTAGVEDVARFRQLRPEVAVFDDWAGNSNGPPAEPWRPTRAGRRASEMIQDELDDR